MAKSFENTVARYRKASEMIEELKECLETLTAECGKLESEIVEYLAANPKAYNVYQRKTSSAGLVGRNFFTVTFSQELARTQAGKRLDDQEWLSKLWADKVGVNYQTTKRSLLKSKVNADVKAGTLDAATMKALGLKYERKASVVVKRIPEDAELATLRSEAEALVEETED